MFYCLIILSFSRRGPDNFGGPDLRSVGTPDLEKDQSKLLFWGKFNVMYSV